MTRADSMSNSTTEIQAAWLTGAQAYVDGRAQAQNPHKPGTLHNAWHRGWLEQRKALEVSAQVAARVRELQNA